MNQQVAMNQRVTTDQQVATNQQVAIAGAGPVGLWLAAELRLAGITVTVLEPRLEPDPKSKALTVHPRTIELLASRGLEKPFLEEGLHIPSGHFAVLDSRLDFGLLETRYPFTLALLQSRTEELFEIHARAAGADIRRGHRVTGLTETPDSVTVHIEGPDGPYDEEALYVAGCDGTRSTVRTSAQILTPATTSPCWASSVTSSWTSPRPVRRSARPASTASS